MVTSVAAPLQFPDIPVPVLGPIVEAMSPSIERVLGLSAINDRYARFRSRGVRGEFYEDALHELGLHVDIEARDLARIPSEGPLVVVANHPFGAVDGLLLGYLLRRVRPDVKLLSTYLLRGFEELHESCLFVDPFEEHRGRAANRVPIRRAVHWVRSGGVLGVFPSGGVSHVTWKQRQVTDPKWQEQMGRLVTLCKAPVVPVYFRGRNSLLFQLAGLMHKRLRTALLAREVLNKHSTRVGVRIGRMIDADRVQRSADITSELRVRTYMLSDTAQRGPLFRDTHPHPTATLLAPIETGRTTDIIEQEINALPDDAYLMRKGDFEVYVSRPEPIPNVMHELGRLREWTFRGVGEGTGHALDLSPFDTWYHHLFIWHRTNREIVGAYRLGATDEIIPKHGASGLYSDRLFRYRSRFLNQMEDALELGRSFVRPEYQRQYLPLMLLWKGIGAFVVRHPQYTRLFGPVSISNDYAPLSRRVLLAFLEQYRCAESPASLVRPRVPVKLHDCPHWNDAQLQAAADSMQDVDEIIKDIEQGERAMPVLVRQYLKLNATVMGFNVDPEFGSVIDALMVVDLLRIPDRSLQHYLGREGAQTFRRAHVS